MEMAGFRFDGMNLLDMFCEALVIWEASTGAVLYTNESARALYGYSCGEASALSIDDIFPDWEGGLRKGSFSIRTATHRKKVTTTAAMIGETNECSLGYSLE